MWPVTCKIWSCYVQLFRRICICKKNIIWPLTLGFVPMPYVFLPNIPHIVWHMHLNRKFSLEWTAFNWSLKMYINLYKSVSVNCLPVCSSIYVYIWATARLNYCKYICFLIIWCVEPLPTLQLYRSHMMPRILSHLRGMIKKFWSLPCIFVQRHFWDAYHAPFKRTSVYL